MQYMTLSGWIQFLVFLVALAAITKPMGIYLLGCSIPTRKADWDCWRRSSVRWNG